MYEACLLFLGFFPAAVFWGEVIYHACGVMRLIAIWAFKGAASLLERMG